MWDRRNLVLHLCVAVVDCVSGIVAGSRLWGSSSSLESSMRDGIDEDLLDSSSPSLGAGSDGESGERCGRT